MKKIILLICFFAFNLTVSSNVAAQTPTGLNCNLYVSPLGSDSNPGTITQPYKTIGKATTIVNPGDVVCVRGGTYNGKIFLSRSGTATSKITYQSYPGEIAVIDGTGLSLNSGNSLIEIQTGVSYNVVSNFVIQNAGSATNGGRGITINGKFNLIVGNKIQHIADSAILNNEGTDSEVRNNEILDTVTSNKGSNGCRTDITGGWPSALNTWGTSARVKWLGNYIHDNCGEGIVSKTGDRIIGNTFKDNWSVDIYIDTATDIVVDGNLVYETESSYIPIGSTEIWRKIGTGLQYGDEQTCPSTIPNPNIIFMNNIVVGTRQGFEFYNFQPSCSGLKNIQVINNTFANTWDNGINITNGNHSQTVFVNNIVYPRQGLALNIENPSNFKFTNNLFYFQSGISTNLFKWGSTNYDFNNWKSISANVTGNTWADPLFINRGNVNPTAADFKFGSTSPAIDTGINTSTSFDYFQTQRPQGTYYDIGAFEYPNATSCPKKILGDLNCDNLIDIFDYNLLLSNFGNKTCGNIADLNTDCTVDIFDYNILLQNFAK